MSDCRITYVSKSGSGKSHEHITHVGSSTWRWTREQVISSIEAGTNTFFVLDQNTNRRADVAVVRVSNGTSYIRTYADGIWSDNLLALADFPALKPFVTIDARY